MVGPYREKAVEIYWIFRNRFMRCQAEHQDRGRHGCQARRLAVASYAQDVVRLPVLRRNFGRSSVGRHRHALRIGEIS